MTMQEIARFILWLQAAGWSGDEINRFVLYIESGDNKYFPAEGETIPSRKYTREQ